MPLTETKTYFPHFEIGQYSYGNLKIPEGYILKVGKFCSIADDVCVLECRDHRIDWITTFPFSSREYASVWDAVDIQGFPSGKGEITIGNDVWIGTGATLMGGITIHDGAVIGAKSVVTQDVPPYSIAAGNPCRVIKYRFSEEDIKFLLELQWWNWPDIKIKRNVKILCSGDIQKLKEGVLH